MSLLSAISQRSNKRMKVERYIDHTIDQITSRTTGKDPLSAINMWVGDPYLNTVSRSPLLWADDLRSQLTGHVEYKNGGWGQGAGGVAITRRHLLNCAHWPDSFIGKTVRFIKDGGGGVGEYFETTIIDQYPTSGYMSFEGNSYDLEVFLLNDELPEWVHIFSIIQFGEHSTYITSGNSRTSGKVLPTISISQGTNAGSTDPQRLYMGNNWAYQVKDVISGDGSFYDKKHPSPDIYSYYYEVFVGDSGTPAFTLINDNLYLFGIVTNGNYGVSIIYKDSHVRFINELIRLVDLSSGISTGYTVTTTDFGSLQF
jgi:hypothetical protein